MNEIRGEGKEGLPRNQPKDRRRTWQGPTKGKEGRRTDGGLALATQPQTHVTLSRDYHVLSRLGRLR